MDYKNLDLIKKIAKKITGCDKCYGKGYASIRNVVNIPADFIGDKSYSRVNHQMNFCSCERGQQLQFYMNDRIVTELRNINEVVKTKRTKKEISEIVLKRIKLLLK